MRAMRHLCLAQMDTDETTKALLGNCSDEASSDAQSQSSIQQTSKYIYVE